jgi:hypothetical protein
MSPNTNYTCVVTSCDRHDLLKTTMESFYAVCDQEPQKVIIIEDSDKPMPEFLKGDIWRSRNVQWITNGSRIGQLFSIDRAYREVTTDFIFHMEDDWLFQRQISPFIRESKDILNAHPEIIMVSLRGQVGWHPLVKVDKYPFLIAEPFWRGVWGGLAFNPGLRRTSDWKKLGSYGAHVSYGTHGLEHEGKLSKMLLDRGYRIADLGRPVVTHIGGNRSRAVEDLPPLPKILIAVPTCFSFQYERWEQKDEKTRFHANGPNEQTQAVRDTWAKDVLPFKNVTLKFFYGKPSDGFPRQPLADEVFLDVPDGYGGLPLKTVALCKYAVENGYKFIYKADTDTFVHIDRLLIEIMENHFDYAGYRHANVCSGGPGYLLSDTAAKIVATHGNEPGEIWAEDTHVSRVLARHGIEPLMLPNHRSGMSAHFFFPEGFDPSRLTGNEVSMHAVFPREMRQMYEYSKTGKWER